MASPRDSLDAALRQVNWHANVEHFLKYGSVADDLARDSNRIALWAKQLEIADADNPALSFVREMQINAQYVAALAGLSLYKPAASAMRCMVESSLYYSYFRSHPVELASLVRVNSYYIEKGDILDFHNTHSPRYPELQAAFGLTGKLNVWYRHISAVVHGQLPGQWIGHAALGEIAPVPSALEVLVSEFGQAVEIVHTWFLCTVAQDLWQDFSVPAKKALLAGIPGDKKTRLGLGIA